MIDKLPEVVFKLILFKYLSYEDIFRLKLVSKNINQLINQLNFIKLNLFIKNYPYNDYLFYNNQLINYPNSFKINNIKLLNQLEFKNRFNKIQQLTINCKTNFYSLIFDDLSCLNYFENLLHLEIKTIATLKGILDLKNLQICLIYTLNYSNFKMNTPQLIALSISEESKPIIIDCNLKYLSIKFLNDRDELYLMNLCSKFNKLYTINFKSIENLNFILDKINNDQLNLPFLNKIELDKCWCFKDLDILINKLSLLKQNSNTKNIKFSINNNQFNLVWLNELSKLLSTNKDFSKINNYLLNYLNSNLILDCLFPSIRQINELDQNTNITEQLIYKLKNVVDLKINKDFKIDFELFRLMTSIWNQIIYLDISYHHLIELFDLKQNYHDTMSNNFLNLKYLTIQKDSKILNLNKFKSIIIFKNLKEINCAFNLDKEIQFFLFNNCLSLEEIFICTENKTRRITIHNLSNNRIKSKNVLEIVFFILVFLIIEYLN